MATIARNPDIIDADQVAAMLGMNRTTVIRYTNRGFIPGKRIGFVYRYSLKEIEKMIPGEIESPARGVEDAEHAGAALQAG